MTIEQAFDELKAISKTGSLTVQAEYRSSQGEPPRFVYSIVIDGIVAVSWVSNIQTLPEAVAQAKRQVKTAAAERARDLRKQLAEAEALAD